MKKQWQRIAAAVFVIYVGVVLKLTVFRAYTMDEPQWNFSLLVQLLKVWQTNGVWEFLRLFLGNIGWFVPFGFLVPFFWKQQTFWKVTAGGFLFSFLIEVLQFVSKKGYTELDDLILNTLGCMLGYCFYHFFTKKVYRSIRNFSIKKARNSTKFLDK